jgi:hypothetical protein
MWGEIFYSQPQYFMYAKVGGNKSFCSLTDLEEHGIDVGKFRKTLFISFSTLSGLLFKDPPKIPGDPKNPISSLFSSVGGGFFRILRCAQRILSEEKVREKENNEALLDLLRNSEENIGNVSLTDSREHETDEEQAKSSSEQGDTTVSQTSRNALPQSFLGGDSVQATQAKVDRQATATAFSTTIASIGNIDPSTQAVYDAGSRSIFGSDARDHYGDSRDQSQSGFCQQQGDAHGGSDRYESNNARDENWSEEFDDTMFDYFDDDEAAQADFHDDGYPLNVSASGTKGTTSAVSVQRQRAAEWAAKNLKRTYAKRAAAIAKPTKSVQQQRHDALEYARRVFGDAVLREEDSDNDDRDAELMETIMAGPNRPGSLSSSSACEPPAPAIAVTSACHKSVIDAAKEAARQLEVQATDAFPARYTAEKKRRSKMYLL